MNTTEQATTVLSLKWTISRARDTDGYPVVTLTDENTAKRYRAMGGGYDMVGTVLGQWLTDARQDALRPLSGAAYYRREHDAAPLTVDQGGLYGLYAYPSENRVSIDGACGLESVKRIAEAAGLTVTERRGGRRRDLIGFTVIGFTVTDPA